MEKRRGHEPNPKSIVEDKGVVPAELQSQLYDISPFNQADFAEERDGKG